MNSRTFIKFCLAIIGVVIVLALVTSVIIYEDEIMRELTSKTITIETNESSSLPSEKDITFEEIYRTSIPFGSIRVYGRIYIDIVHDNKRNVTCYLYKDGISCIPDYYIGVKE